LGSRQAAQKIYVSYFYVFFIVQAGKGWFSWMIKSEDAIKKYFVLANP